MKTVDITAPWKLAVIALVAACLIAYITVGELNGDVDTSQAWALLTLVVGYLIGNGTGARKGFVSVPPFQPTPARQAEILAKILEEDLPYKEREKVERLVQRTKEVEGEQ